MVDTNKLFINKDKIRFLDNKLLASTGTTPAIMEIPDLRITFRAFCEYAPPLFMPLGEVLMTSLHSLLFSVFI